MEQQHRKTPWLIGKIEACIDNDRRYTTKIKVYYIHESDTVRIERYELFPSGGMDSQDGCSSRPTKTCEASGLRPADVVKAVRSCFDDTIIRYGKPTKNFAWYVEDGADCDGIDVASTERGLSVSVVKKALDFVKS